jgi:beta-lactamase regulating signal transducer with metallopeptidase domain
MVSSVVWQAARRLREESERATDERVLSAGVCAGDYGQCLLDFVRLLQTTPGRTIMKEAIAVARPSNFGSRLHALLDAQRNRRSVSRCAVLAALVGMAVVAMTLATVRVTSSATAATAGPETSPSTRSVDLSSPLATVNSFIDALNRYGRGERRRVRPRRQGNAHAA